MTSWDRHPACLLKRRNCKTAGRMPALPGRLFGEDAYMRSLRTALVLGLIIAVTASARPVAQVKTDPQVVAKLGQILEKSGYPYRKAAENVWVINFKGRSSGDINVLVTSAEDLVVIGAVVAEKSTMKVTPEMMFKVLRLVHNIDRVKIGFDNDEDLFLRAEIYSKCMGVEEFKSTVEQVSSGVDQVRAEIKSSLLK